MGKMQTPVRWTDIVRDRRRKAQKLDDMIQYIDFLPDNKLPIIWLKDGSLLILFRLEGLDYEALPEEERNDYSHFTQSAFGTLPNEGAGFMLSNLLIRDTPKLVPLKENPQMAPTIQDARNRKQAFWEALVPRSFSNRVLCGLRYFPVNRKPAELLTLIREHKVHEFNIKQFSSAVEQIEQGFIALSKGLDRFKFCALDRKESFAALYEIINFSDAPAYRPDMSLNAQLAHSRYSFPKGKEYFVVNETEYMSLMGIKYLPPASVAMYLRRFYELGFPLIMRQAIGFVNKEKLFKKQDFNLPIATALSRVDTTNLAYAEEIMNFRQRVEQNKELPVYWHFSVLVRAKDEETLRNRRAEVSALLKEIGSFGMVENENGNLELGVISIWPGHDRFYARHSLILTGNAADLFSAYVLYPGDANPVDYLQDRLHGIFSYHPFTQRESAHHRAICGPTAGGKSFFAIKDLISHLIENPMVWIIDLSASYLDLFELLQEEMPSDTAIMRVSREESSFAFNPFLLDNPREPVSDKQFDFCMGFLKLMAGQQFNDAISQETMEKALKEFFASYRGLLANLRGNHAPAPLTILADMLKNETETRGLAAAFSGWTKGRRGKLFISGRDTIQKARYCYFDLRDLEDEPELTKAIVYVIFSKVYRDITDERVRSVQKRFILDEAHRYIADPAFSFWIEQIIRAGRHWNIMMDLITQSINDLQSNAILTNLKQGFFFPGMPNIEDSFAKLQMTKYHIEQYKKLNPSRYEVFYWSQGGLRRQLRPLADPYTYWLATTDANEREMKRRMKERCGNVHDAIDELVKITKHCQSNRERVSTIKTYFGDKQ
jgi:type IV secretory pathway VirB4 component